MPLPEPTERPVLTIDEAAEILGISRSTAYLEAARFLETGGAEGLPVIRMGRRRLVPCAELRRLVGIDPPASPPELPPAA